MMGSPTPFGSNLYGQLSGTGGMGLPQRVLTNPPFQVPTTLSNSMGLNTNYHLAIQQSQSSRPQPISPNRGMLNMSVSSLNSQQNLTQMKQRSNQLNNNLLGSNSTLSNLSNFSRQLNDIGHQGSSGSLDYSQFPSLGGRGTAQNQILPSRNYVNMVSKQEPTSEFQIQQEDFPALPGAQNPTSPIVLDTSLKSTTGINYDSAVKDSNKTFADKTIGQSRKGIQTHSDGTLTNVPSGMVGDQFGMVGLLTFIRAADTDLNLVALAPGIDLTTLGLNLNQSETLFTSFQSPWSDLPCRPQDIDYHVPSEYLTNIYVRDKLAPLRLTRYTDDLLFFLFYLYSGDLLQLAAAAELYNRDWRYHKDERLWMTRAPGMEPTHKTDHFERGTYFFFDVNNWRKVPKEFHLDYSKLEERPQLPECLLNNPNGVAGAAAVVANNNNNPLANSVAVGNAAAAASGAVGSVSGNVGKKSAA